MCWISTDRSGGFNVTATTVVDGGGNGTSGSSVKPHPLLALVLRMFSSRSSDGSLVGFALTSPPLHISFRFPCEFLQRLFNLATHSIAGSKASSLISPNRSWPCCCRVLKQCRMRQDYDSVCLWSIINDTKPRPPPCCEHLPLH